MSRSRAVLLLSGLLLGALTGSGLVRASSRRAVTQDPPLVVPRAASPITIDGELEEEAWHGPMARTGPFHGPGDAQGRPYSDARLVVRGDELYLVLYAADEDIQAAHAGHDEPLYRADAFQLRFDTADGERIIDVSPRGVVTDGAVRRNGTVDFSWESHARVAVDTDGTIDNPADTDEEWVVEMAIPLASLGLRGEPGERFGLSIKRCDEVRGFGRSCASSATGARKTNLVLGGQP